MLGRLHTCTAIPACNDQAWGAVALSQCVTAVFEHRHGEHSYEQLASSAALFFAPAQTKKHTDQHYKVLKYLSRSCELPKIDS